MAVTKRVSIGGLRIGPAGFLLLGLAACGTDTRPGATSYTPSAPEPQVAVSMPLPPPRPSRAPSAPTELVSAINRLSANFSGKKGIAVRAVDDGWTVEVGGRQRLPQQ
ncbi:beta-lactamase, partial [Sphingomonas sanguinis]